MGRVLQAKKVPWRAEGGKIINLGIDATQTKRHHNVFRHASYQRELGLLHAVRVCYSTRVTAVLDTPTSDWRLVDSVVRLPVPHPTGTPFNTVQTLPHHERREAAAANRAKLAAAPPSHGPAVSPSGSSPSSPLQLERLTVSSEEEVATGAKTTEMDQS